MNFIEIKQGFTMTKQDLSSNLNSKFSLKFSAKLIAIFRIKNRKAKGLIITIVDI